MSLYDRIFRPGATRFPMEPSLWKSAAARRW